MHKYVNFPDLPNNLILEISSYFRDNQSKLISINGSNHFKTLHSKMVSPDTLEDISNNIGIPIKFADELYSDYCEYSIMPAPKTVNDWIYKNIPIDNIYASIQAFTNGKFFIPHRDVLRDTAYNYIIELGGTDVKTCFYKPKQEYSHLDTKAIIRTFIPYDRIELIDHVVFEKNKWHEIKVNNIHSVENIDPTSIRLSLTLSVINQ